MINSKDNLLKIIASAHKLASQSTGEAVQGPSGNGFKTEPAIVGPIAATLLEHALRNPQFAETLFAL